MNKILCKRRIPARDFRAGFTLVELLIVVAIIVMLIALMLPATRNALDRAKATHCLTSCRLLSAAMANYAVEYDNRYPPMFMDPDGSSNTQDSNGDGTPDSSHPNRKWMWYLYDKDYARNPDTYYCAKYNRLDYKRIVANGQYNNFFYRVVPEWSATVADDSADASGHWGIETSLAQNEWVSYRKTNDVKFNDPGRIPAVMDCVFYRVNRANDWNYWYDPIARHFNLVNIGYADGHAAAVTARSLYTIPWLYPEPSPWVVP